MTCIEKRGRLKGQIAFIDPSLEAWQILATGVKKGIEVIVLDPVRDAIEQITAALARRKGVEGVHIICHGSPGALHLGNTIVNSDNLDRHAALLQTWRSNSIPIANSPVTTFPYTLHPTPQNPRDKQVNKASVQERSLTTTVRAKALRPGGQAMLSPTTSLRTGYVVGESLPLAHSPRTGGTLLTANLILYGCQVAAGEIGRAFLEKLHQLTGANIAASSSPVGNRQLGGNWELDATFGKKPAAETAFSATAMAAYPAVLSVSFAPQTTFGVGDKPRSVAVGDFNSDGSPDLAVGNAVLLGDGSGSFGPQTTFGAGSGSLSVVEDFNGDGKDDLAVGNAVLLGDGSGGFGTQTTFGVGVGSWSVAVGDLNGDDSPDLAVANLNGSVSVLLGDGSGSFGPQGVWGGFGPSSVAVGDLNGDGKDDLAITYQISENVWVLLGDGSGGRFGTGITFGVGSRPLFVAVGDFNGDGSPDLATANYDIHNVSVLLGDGSGGFGTATTFGAGSFPRSLAVGDFNGDGSPDLATANQNSDNVSVLLGDGSGSFRPQTTFGAGSRPISLVVEDFNGDGRPDLAVANYRSNNVSVLLNTTAVSIAQGSTPTEAGPTNGSFDITLDEPAPAGGLTVNFNLTGSTATDPADYSLTAGTNITGVTATTFTIAAGTTSATLNVVPIDDREIETGGETVNIQLETGSNYIVSTSNNTAALTIADNDSSEIEVTESSTSIPDGGSFDFGSSVVGSSNIIKTFTINNSGNAELTLGAATLTGDGYSFVGAFPTDSIAAGSSTTFQIQLDASAPDTFDGYLSFVNNDSDENPYNFDLTGQITGELEPEIEVIASIADGSTSLDFGNTTIGTAVNKTFIIQNIGGAELNLSSLQLPAGFSLVGDFPKDIAPGSSKNLEIKLDASKVGSFSGPVSFNNNDADEDPFDFVISGTVDSNPPFVANSVFDQNVGFHNSNQFSFDINTYVDPDPGDSITYSIALANTLDYSWFDWTRGDNRGWYRLAKEDIDFPAVEIPGWLDFDPNTRTVTIDENRPYSFRYGMKITGTDLSGQSVSEFVWFKSYLGGFIIDNYIAGATVFWDENKNGIQDAGELSTTSDQAGEFNLNVPIEQYDTNNNGIIDSEDGQIVATGGIDTATGLPLETPVVATPESTVVTLLTTLVADLVNKGQSVNNINQRLADANEQVVTALSLPSGIDINSLDAIAATENNETGGTETLTAMVKVQNAITQTAKLLDGASNADFNAIVSNVVSAITSQIQTEATLDVSNSATLETIINDAAIATQQNDPNIDLTRVQAIASGAAQVMAESNQQIDTLVASGASGTTLTAQTANIQKITLGNVPEELEAAASGTKDIALVVAQNTGAALQAKIASVSPSSSTTPSLPSVPILDANIELVRNDATVGTDSDDTYIGDSSDNSYLAYSGNDILFGNSGSDWMNGNRGDDSLDGGEGNDTLYGGKDNDTISGNNGADVIFGNRGSDRLLGNNGDDFINGNQAEDILFGGNGNDLLYGGKENDTLNGGDGSDTMSGDLGNDILSGGNGSDRFVLKPGYGSDILTDFEDGQDFVALADGLTFAQLAISQENGSTLIRFEDELLATLENIDASLISSADFLAFG